MFNAEKYTSFAAALLLFGGAFLLRFLVDVYCRFPGLHLKHPLVHLLHQVTDKFVNVLVELGTGLVVLHLVLVCQALGFFVRNSALILQIDFIAHHHFHDIWISMLVNRLQPRFHIVEARLVGDVVGDDNSVRLLIERVSNGLESLLACGVPDLDSDVLASGSLEGGGHVVEADGGHVGLGELLLRVPESKRAKCTFSGEKSFRPHRRPR